ncbi:TPA: hypothetical protein RQK07_004364 [Vibrio vulnificus]|uniref:hypothetical protein n=1 Tax=Vibrio TaxID=662 RepID=UPI0019D4AEF2|nr:MULTISPECIES: hypothetical protein [Vibrio]MBN8105658.1 hypothetical protein [Vibrio vulnificus]MCD1213072.1 hypothetical protein [Vibrio cholerae]MCU8461713.1 hypothetical protein [Vibrio vulnificus]HAT8540071.1 hypothetical protein [Vibrio vulnificus]HDY7452112.1 hypothetical protein [Vibrio vulnificus]
MKIIKKVLLTSLILFNPLQAYAVGIDQDTLCTAVSWKAADNEGKCKEGSKIAFLPNSFGNEQLPIMFVALNCDLNHNVSLTNGGVVCVFKPAKNVVEASK